MNIKHELLRLKFLFHLRTIYVHLIIQILFFLLNTKKGLAILCAYVPQNETCTFEENITGSTFDTLEKSKLRFLHLKFLLNFWRILADSRGLKFPQFIFSIVLLIC